VAQNFNHTRKEPFDAALLQHTKQPLHDPASSDWILSFVPWGSLSDGVPLQDGIVWAFFAAEKLSWNLARDAGLEAWQTGLDELRDGNYFFL
jgi:hypothetical protein